MIESHPAASVPYLALILSTRGSIVPTLQKLRSQVIHLEPTLSYAIAWAGYEQSNALLLRCLQEALQRLQARERAILAAKKLDVRAVWRLRDDVARFGELVEAAGEKQNDLKRNKLQFEMDIHMSVVELVGVRWELEECGF